MASTTHTIHIMNGRLILPPEQSDQSDQSGRSSTSGSDAQTDEVPIAFGNFPVEHDITIIRDPPFAPHDISQLEYTCVLPFVVSESADTSERVPMVVSWITPNGTVVIPMVQRPIGIPDRFWHLTDETRKELSRPIYRLGWIGYGRPFGTTYAWYLPMVETEYEMFDIRICRLITEHSMTIRDALYKYMQPACHDRTMISLMKLDVFIECLSGQQQFLHDTLLSKRAEIMRCFEKGMSKRYDHLSYSDFS